MPFFLETRFHYGMILQTVRKRSAGGALNRLRKKMRSKEGRAGHQVRSKLPNWSGRYIGQRLASPGSISLILRPNSLLRLDFTLIPP
ncbi:MAG: hypothetical protein ACI8UO_006757 [Verrucomicrobiales bacterium]|jgi:hypothetical protein